LSAAQHSAAHPYRVFHIRAPGIVALAVMILLQFGAKLMADIRLI
jgi:hypothetical protein